jgi:predicted negative regulator of RcsB-dependent stress response
MSAESVFNKRLTTETTLDKVEGLLEHFNLPPKAIAFIRRHAKMLQISIVIILIVVVAVSLYGNYRKKTIEESSTALAKAIASPRDKQGEALQQVVNVYGNTPSARWAKIELAHLEMKGGAYSKAAEQYRRLLPEIKKDEPLFPLVLLGLAQALEADKKFAEAGAEYEQLKGYKGFEHLAFTGQGRLEEAQGNFTKAIGVYNSFLTTIGDDPSFSQAKTEIDGKIARLKTKAK